ncbi:hypothetical protein RJ45_00030 [Photobacterium gaetbulicola]|uniref:Alginate lyase domain-containing protein n=1 Tax=Photobacterium gaetbulicola TaxID=1295392 RepID=A0A0B9H9P5_9GAMM|nr:alginate lyase family protein [Photobacterium gaetbulicola]KHT65577.1 hypothetical protein RJ45_00030 [Photobacterium gaetbulicola]
MKSIIASTLLIFSMYSVADPIDFNRQFTYIDVNKIENNKQKIENNEALYTLALSSNIKLAEKALNSEANPVTNKPAPGPSGDLHDYMSIGPYWWPDETKEDGLPWVRKDGQVNPMTRGDNTDQRRAKAFLTNLENLNTAYIYTNQTKYLAKAKDLIEIWLVSPKTKMNPNLDYAQGVPGDSTGRPFGIIEFAQVSNIITSIELIETTDIATDQFLKESKKWLDNYLNWLLTSDLGREEQTRANNHGTWYDVQVLGLMMHLGRTEQANDYAEAFKLNRIASQIQADGSQPHELFRTKSINYSSMNLRAFLKVANLASKLDVDLLNYKGDKGQSIRLAAEYLVPYVENKKQWTHDQIGDNNLAFDKKTIPALLIANSIFEEEILSYSLIEKRSNYIDSMAILMF